MDSQPPLTTPAGPRKKKNVQRTLQGQRTLIPELQDPAIIQEYRHCLEKMITTTLNRGVADHLSLDNSRENAGV